MVTLQDVPGTAYPYVIPALSAPSSERVERFLLLVCGTVPVSVSVTYPPVKAIQTGNYQIYHKAVYIGSIAAYFAVKISLTVLNYTLV